MTHTAAQSGVSLRGVDLLTLADFSAEQILGIFDTAADLKRSPEAYSRALAGFAVVMLFEKPSLRTRLSFEIGIAKLGGAVCFLDHGEQRLGARETVEDYARNIERYADAIVARTYLHSTIESLAAHADIPVINALSDRYHPCQALADCFTLLERFGSLKGFPLAYVGDGNNVCASLMISSALLGMRIHVVSPEGYGPADDVVELCDSLARASGASVSVSTDIGTVAGCKCVYTDTWASMGMKHEADLRERVFSEYRVTQEIMALADSDAVFMHCLPAKRGVEVSSAVIDSQQSIVFDQAENRMHTQNALLIGMLRGSSI